MSDADADVVAEYHLFAATSDGTTWSIATPNTPTYKVASTATLPSAQAHIGNVDMAGYTPSSDDGGGGGGSSIVVTVAQGVYYFDGEEKPVLTFTPGNTYTFNMSDSSNSGHPLAFEVDGTTVSVGVISTGTAGQDGAQVQLTVPADATGEWKYVCTVHGEGMGNSITIVGSGEDTDSGSSATYVVTAGGDGTYTVTITDASATLQTISEAGYSISMKNAAGVYSDGPPLPTFTDAGSGVFTSTFGTTTSSASSTITLDTVILLVDGSESEFGVYAHSAGLDGLVESEILGHTQVQSGYSGITTALTIVYDDISGLVTVSGLDNSIQASDVEMSVINTQLSSGDTGYALVVTPENIVADGGGTAVFSYSDLNRSIQDLVLVDGKAAGTVANYNALDVYHGTTDNGQATGAQAMDNDVFTIFGYEVEDVGGGNYDVTLKTELGWEYSGNPSVYPASLSAGGGRQVASLVDDALIVELGKSSFTGTMPAVGEDVTQVMIDALPSVGLELTTINVSFDPSIVTYDPEYSELQGLGVAKTDVAGEVGIVIVSADGIGNTNLDGAVIAKLAFTATEDAVLNISIFDAGGADSGFDYPIGFTIDL
jgi:plastocyanin